MSDDEPNPNVHKLTSLQQKSLVRLDDTKLINRPRSVHSINEEIWVCLKNCAIQIFDRNLKCLRTLSEKQWQFVCGVTELSDGEVALAGSGGLYHLTATGETKTAIDKANRYNSSVMVDDKLFAYCNDPPRLIIYTMQNDRWKTHDTISLARVVTRYDFVSLAAANGKIFACSGSDAKKVFVLSQSGEVLQTHGKPGTGSAGELFGPELCAVDSEESFLVADLGNDRLQVCEDSGQWSVLDLQPPVDRPLRAAVIDNKLYVSSRWGRFLAVYTTEQNGSTHSLSD